MPERFDRVLVASRGTVARRLARMLAEEGLETVSVFNEPDVEQPWVEDADFSQYLNGSHAAETYLDPGRLVSAALDTGCEMLHPGFGYLAEDIDMHDIAARANVGVLGVSTEVLKKVYGRFRLFQQVQGMAIPAARCSEDIPIGADPEKVDRTAATLGYPLVVRAAHARVARRVEAPEALAGAILQVRTDAARLARDLSVYLEGLADGLRTLQTVLVADHHGSLVCLGSYADAVGLNGHWWLAELGEAVAGEVLREKMERNALQIGEAIGFTGVGAVRWVVTPTGGCYFGGMTIALPEAWPLLDEMLGIDLARTGLRIDRNDRLAWDHYDAHLDRHGLLLRLVHVDPETGERPEGLLERLDLPSEDVLALAGAAEGQPVTAETDPVLAELVVTGGTRQAALVQARAALEAIDVRGVVTNRDALIAVLADREFWQGRYDIASVRRQIEA